MWLAWRKRPTATRRRDVSRLATTALPSWAHAVVVGGKVYIGNQGTATAYNVKARS